MLPLNKVFKHNISNPATICRKKFLHYFPKGFNDKKYYSWERGYKWEAHLQWKEHLNKEKYNQLIINGDYYQIANQIIKIETKTNLLFSFEKMALRDAIRDKGAARDFSLSLFDYIYGESDKKLRFQNFSDVLKSLPRKQTRVRTWPLQTVFGFLADPNENIFLKPIVTKKAALSYNFDFYYKSEPNWETYQSLLEFCKLIANDNVDLKPKDLIDIQSFIWVMGSLEYPVTFEN